MADKRTTPQAPEAAPETPSGTPQETLKDAGEGPRRKKRAAPTIDLTATELPPVQPDPSPDAAAAPEPAPEPAKAAPPQPTRRTDYATAIAAGFAGAVIAATVIAALWAAGVLPAGSGSDSDEPDANIVALQKQVQALQNRPAPASAAADSKALAALGQRVSQIEATLTKLPAGDGGMAERLTAADNAMKSLGVALAALNRRGDDIAAKAAQAGVRADEALKAVSELRATMQDAAKNASALSPAELDALQKRIAGLEQSAKTARADIAKASSADMAARLALSAAALRDAVMSGAPFGVELAQARSLGADATIVATLAPFAATGVPKPAALAEGLRALLPAMLKTTGAQAPQGGFLEKLEANAGRLVRIRPVEAPAGDDASAVLARVEIDAAKVDIAAALADIGKLPEAARQQAAGWVGKAMARQKALAAARQYAANTARALGPK